MLMIASEWLSSLRVSRNLQEKKNAVNNSKLLMNGLLIKISDNFMSDNFVGREVIFKRFSLSL